jgi:GNAT superfamily N-acetyltransferase
MRRDLPGGYEVDDDRSRVDVDAVHDFLVDAYWSAGRSRETVERLVREATRVVAAYAPDGSLVAFCRVVSDAENMAWLGDVFVLPEHRGRGLGAAIVDDAVSHPDHAGCNWYLGTRDAHELYARFGFQALDDGRTMVRPKPGL